MSGQTELLLCHYLNTFHAEAHQFNSINMQKKHTKYMEEEKSDQQFDAVMYRSN